MATKTQTKTQTKSAEEKKPRKTMKQWRSELKQANDVGFSHGYYAVEDLPKATGAKMAARAGFSDGINARKQTERNAARARKYKK